MHTLECGDNHVGDQRVQLLLGIVVLVALALETHADAVGNRPAPHKDGAGMRRNSGYDV